MAWTTIADANLDPDSPARSVDALALRDNPIAIANGDSGAPTIDPINAMDHGGAYGAVGTYLFALNVSGGGISAGGTIAGSGLDPAGVKENGGTYTVIAGDIDVSSNQTITTTSPAGTWRAMGLGSDDVMTLWLRIA